MRAEKAAVVRRLHAEGRTMREIANLLGISRTYASSLYHDPTGSGDRERKRRYSGTCIDCGAPTCGNDGVALAPKRCHPCRVEYQHSDSYRASITLWSKARLIAAIQDWAAIYGEPPAIPDWNPFTARLMHDEARAQRWEHANGRWPWFSSVIQRFGSWNAGIEAAGFTPRVASGGGGNMARRRRKTHCKHEHEFTAENTVVWKDGHRRCRECIRRTKREAYQRTKEQVAA